MSVSLEYLERCAAESGHSIGALEKVVRLGELSADISRHPLVGKALALKGGTALNLCFGAPKRLSVDLDYNYIGQLDREEMLADRPRIEEAVEQLAERRNYEVQRSADTFAGRKLYLGYKSKLGPDERIEVDLNFLFRLPLQGTNTRKMWQPGELDKPRVKLVSTVELCVGKLLALLDRSAPRDAWDVGRLKVRFPEVLDSTVFRVWFVALSVTLDHPVGTYGRSRLQQRLTDRVINEQLRPMLARDETIDADSLVEKAWAVLGPLLDLRVEEEEFVRDVHSGELRPELLCGDDVDLGYRVGKHPAIKWKLVNVCEHAARRSDSTARLSRPNEALDT